jgi:hypothetical protein
VEEMKIEMVFHLTGEAGEVMKERWEGKVDKSCEIVIELVCLFILKEKIKMN